jgi:formate dehydrogenase subunit gamma
MSRASSTPATSAPGSSVPFDPDTVASLIAARKSLPGALLPILHAIQDRLGHIPAEALPLIAGELNISRAEVHGVVTYYHYFRQQPPGRHVIQICRAEACQASGGNQLAAHASKTLGCAFHHTTADGQFTLEPVYCLGQCGCAPAMTIDADLHARVTPAKFDQLLAQKRGAQ